MDDMEFHDKALRILKARHAKKLQGNNFELETRHLLKKLPLGKCRVAFVVV